MGQLCNDKRTKESRVRLTINLNNSRIRITLKVRCTKDDFDAAMSSRSNKARELRLIINNYIFKAETILQRLIEPSKESFLRLFKSETDLFKSNKTDVYYFYQLKYEEMIKSDRIGTAKYFKGCARSLKEFKSILYFEDIDEKFLREYQTHLLKKGNSISTSSLRLRCLRIMFNIAIKEGFVSEKHYPFRNFSLPSASKSKKVLYPPQIKLLYDYVPQTLREERAKDYFFFCFLSNGMNFKDMAHLKWQNINGNTLSFIRQKTKNTTTEINEITVHLHNEAKRIIEKWGNQDKVSTAYVFPILPQKFKSIEHLEEIRNRKRKIVNRSLTAIANKLGFDFPITITLARHSFATTLKLNGTSVAFISELLGHTSLKTTQHYLKSIPGEQRKLVSDSLLDFDRIPF